MKSLILALFIRNCGQYNDLICANDIHHTSGHVGVVLVLLSLSKERVSEREVISL